MKRLHLICNAHLDPMWQWNWEEGAAAAISTFRAAVRFCEEYDTFVFNHNEALLYQWTEMYEPETFERIRKQVARGHWKIMGGWYLQPDCNLPSGEAMVRQIREGNRYFREKFGIDGFETAICFDSFGHSRGLIPILRKCGYRNYMTVRPGREARPDLPEFFRWKGFDGSELLVSKTDAYNSPMGHVGEYLREELPKKKEEVVTVLWGVGNHGGGPSRADIETVEAFLRSEKGFEALQSDPDAFFREARERNRNVPVTEEYLGTVFPGTFTSQMRIKRAYRKLETEYFQTERLVAAAQMNGDLPKGEFPELRAALSDLLFSQFHDVLAGTLGQAAEQNALQRLSHGLEETERIRARAYFSMIRAERPAVNGEYPVFVFNPFPYPVRTVVDCEVQLADQNWTETSTYFQAVDKNSEVPSQIEKESGNVNLDWRKRVIFLATLKPMQMSRFDLYPHRGEKRVFKVRDVGKSFVFSNRYFEAEIDGTTGLLSRWIRRGVNLFRAPLTPVVTEDSEDSWIMRREQYERQQKTVGMFLPLSAEQRDFEGTAEKLPAVRLIESGDVRSVVETALACGDSRIRLRYCFYRDLPYVDLDFEIHWRRKNGCLKLDADLFPGQALGETMFGYDGLPQDQREQPIHRWIAMRNENTTFAVLNRGSYGASCTKTCIRQSLLRSPAYVGHSIGDRPILPEDRIITRMDNGVRNVSLRLIAGSEKLADRLSSLAAVYQTEWFVLPAFPVGEGRTRTAAVEVEDPEILLTACYWSEEQGGWVIRLHNGANRKIRTSFRIMDTRRELEMEPLEVRNFVLKEGTLTESESLLG